MKKIIFILLCVLSFEVNAQSVIKNQTETLEISISSDQDLTNFLIQKFELAKKNIELKQTYKVESLTGTHFTFELKKDDAVLPNFYLKAHVNYSGKLFFIQYNFDNNLAFEISNNSLNTDLILKSVDEKFSIFKTEKIIVLNKKNEFQKAFLVGLYQEETDFYVERTYFSETEFTEKNLKVHFAPQDTTIKVKVFMPDPLTSSINEYGGDFQDAFHKDTSVLIIKTITNTGQSFVSVDTSKYLLYSDSFKVQSQAQENIFSGPNIYFVFEDIYINSEGEILGYNAIFIGDTTNFKSKIITEDYDYLALNNERVEVEVIGDYTGASFSLKNSVFEIDDFSLPVVLPQTSTSNQFFFTRTKSGFEEANAFYHLNNFHSYVNNLGFITLAPQKLKIDVHGANGGDNSFFTNAPSPRLIFGEGGIDDAEDADVVIHEYTHALSYFAAPNSNDSIERRALDEALGDYFSSSYSSQFGDFNMYNVFSWDGHNEFWDGRITNSTKTYLDYDEGKSIYANGEIWSSTLIDIFNEIGKDATDKLVLESLFYNTKGSKFSDVADILLLIDKVLYDKKYRCDIFNVLVNRKFKSGICVGTTALEGSGLIASNTENFATNQGSAYIYIVENNFEKLDYWLTDALGKQIFKVKNVAKQEIEINPSVLPAGVYYLRIQTNNNKYKTKLIKI